MLSGLLFSDNEWSGNGVTTIQGPVEDISIELDRIKIGVEIVNKEGVKNLTADGFIHTIGSQVWDA